MSLVTLGYGSSGGGGAGSPCVTIDIKFVLGAISVGASPLDAEIVIGEGVTLNDSVTGAVVTLAVYSDEACTTLVETLIDGVATNFASGVQKTWATIAGAAVSFTPSEVRTYYVKASVVGGTPAVNTAVLVEALTCIWDEIPAPTDLDVVDDLTGTSLTASATVTDASLTLRFYYGNEYGPSLGYVERSGSGAKQITGLTQGQRYWIAAVAIYDGTNYILLSEPTQYEMSSPTTESIKNTDEQAHLSQFIQHLMIRAKHYMWYHKKVEEAGIPSTMVNVPFSGAPIAANVQYNENVRVADQPGIFQNRGLIPVVRQRTGGLNKADIGFAQVKFGDFTGFCPIEYKVDIDDRLVNSQTGEEYKIVHSTPHENGLYRHLELKWLRP